jgi:uncharacterized membrane protein
MSDDVVITAVIAIAISLIVVTVALVVVTVGRMRHRWRVEFDQKMENFGKEEGDD